MFRMVDKSITVESDRFFRDIPADWYEKDSGNVESPTNWFGIVTIDDDFRHAWFSGYVQDETYAQIPASVQNGTYLVSIDNNGLVYAEQPDMSDLPNWAFKGNAVELFRERIESNYSELEEEYQKWEES